MNPNHLLSVFDQVAEAPDAPARLRRFVLDLAVRGKLVEQDPNDEPASALLERIKRERARAIKGQRFSKNSTSVPDSVLQLPFDPPPDWVRTTIGAICSKTGSGSTPRGGKRAYTDSGIVFLRSQNVYNDGLRLIDVAHIDQATHKKMRGTVVRPADLLLNITGGSIGRCCLVPDDVDGMNVSQHVSIIRVAIDGPQRFLHNVILAPYFQAFIFEEQTGAGRGGLPKYKMDRIPIALPPLAEQQRIVARVEELMTLCDQLEKARANRENTRNRLTKANLARLGRLDPDPPTFRTDARRTINTLPALTARPDQIKQLRQTILNLAVHGKLVKQNPADEPASELLERIAAEKARQMKTNKFRQSKGFSPLYPEESPYRLPPGWQWTYFGSLAGFSAGRTPPRKNPSHWNPGKFPWITIADMEDGAILQRTKEAVSDKARSEVFKRLPVAPGTIIMSFKLTIGKIARLGIPAFHNEAIISIRPYVSEIDPYLFKVLPIFARKGDAKGAVKGATLNRQSLSSIQIPLPPAAEQRRIVARVDELMTLCNGLENGLSRVNSGCSHLLESVLRTAHQ